MSLYTDHLARCIETLESSLLKLRGAEAGSIDYEVYRNAVIKGFELALETAGKLLRKALKPYSAGARAVDELTYKEVFRHGAKHGLVEEAAVARWFTYRENRNTTAHDYGVKFAEETLMLLPGFLEDARRLESMLREELRYAGP